MSCECELCVCRVCWVCERWKLETGTLCIDSVTVYLILSFFFDSVQYYLCTPATVCGIQSNVSTALHSSEPASRKEHRKGLFEGDNAGVGLKYFSWDFAALIEALDRFPVADKCDFARFGLGEDLWI